MNVISGTGSASQHSVGIYLDGNTDGVVATNNMIKNVGSDAIEVHGLNHPLISLEQAAH
jgi:hypothetical protein